MQIVDVEQFSSSWVTAWLEQDLETIESLMAPDYRYVGADGRILGRAEVNDIVQSPQYRLAWGARSEIVVSQATPEVAIVTSRWRGEGRYQGHRFHDDQRCTSVLVKRGAAGWQVVHEHCSPLEGE